MINQHCTHDPVFGYCKGIPDFDIQPTKHPVADKDGNPMGEWTSGGHCRRDKDNCELYTNHIEVKEVESHLVLFGQAKEEKKPEKKTKKVKTIEQGNLF